VSDKPEEFEKTENKNRNFIYGAILLILDSIFVVVLCIVLKYPLKNFDNFDKYVQYFFTGSITVFGLMFTLMQTDSTKSKYISIKLAELCMILTAYSSFLFMITSSNFLKELSSLFSLVLLAESIIFIFSALYQHSGNSLLEKIGCKYDKFSVITLIFCIGLFILFFLALFNLV
jgi:FlaA1/EpsC-like NDP-sugar epimerase